MIDKNTQFLIVGLGLLGGSYAMGLRQEGYHVTGIARRQETIDYALANGMIDEGSIEVGEQVSQADVIIFGLYANTLIEWIQNYRHLFKQGTLLTDVTGVKGCIVEPVQALMPEGVEFIGAHPMAGKETSGIEYANTEMFKQANYIVVPTAKNTQEAIDFSYDLAYTLHFNHIVTLNAKEHDQMIAYLSQLCHVIAVSLMNMHDNEDLAEYTGDSFRDLTRIAKINDKMWTELFLLNKETLLGEVDCFIDTISHFRDTLQAEDTDEMKRLFLESTRRRKYFDKKGKNFQ